VDIVTIIQAVFRRWYVSVPLLILATAAAFYVQFTTPPAFQADGQLLLADPVLDPSGLPASTVDVDEILVSLDAPSVREELESADAVYQVEAEDQATVAVTVSASDAGAAEETALEIKMWLEEYVTAAQADAGFPEAEQIQVRGGERITLTTDEQTEAVQATSVITLFDPTAGVVNPFAASNTTVRLLIVAIESDAGRVAVLERSGPNIGFVLSQSQRDAAPIMGVTTTGSDPQAVLAAFDAVSQVVDEELQRRQDRAEIPGSRRTRVEALAQPGRVVDVSPPVERAAGAIFGLGGFLAVAAAIATDSFMSRRNLRQRDHSVSLSLDDTVSRGGEQLDAPLEGITRQRSSRAATGGSGLGEADLG
jgi:hypothetical protein